MEEANVAIEVTPIVRHWFFDALIVWAALIAAVGASAGAFAIYRQTISREMQAKKEENIHQLNMAIMLGTEAMTNEALLETMLEVWEEDGVDRIAQEVEDISAHLQSKAFDLHYPELGKLGPRICNNLCVAMTVTETFLNNWKEFPHTEDEEEFRTQKQNLVNITGTCRLAWTTAKENLEEMTGYDFANSV